MLDNFKRNINYLRVSVTDRCNLRCRYCMPKEGLSLLGHNDILRYEEILRVIRIAVRLGVAKIRITGGEPLARKGLVDFIAILNTIEGLRDLSLTTNGVLLVEYAERLYQAGMKRINVSLDSLNAEKYRYITRGGQMDGVLKGIEMAHEAGFFPIKINVVAMKGFNDDEILDFARLTLEKPYEVRFIELMPFAQPGRDGLGQYLSNENIKQEIEKSYALRPVNGREGKMDGPARIYQVINGLGRIGFISPMSQHFCHQCNRLRLTADGHLRACLLSDAETDLKGSLRTGCSDEIIESLITETIVQKPLEHHVTSDVTALRKCARTMQAIGG
jgi:GTP 3',8-cyclase